MYTWWLYRFPHGVLYSHVIHRAGSYIGSSVDTYAETYMGSLSEIPMGIYTDSRMASYIGSCEGFYVGSQMGFFNRVAKNHGMDRSTSRQNSTLSVERQKRGNAQRASSSSHEAEGNRELLSAGVRTRGRRPRISTARDNFQSRSPSTKYCELYASLLDRFRLEVRILFYPMRILKLAAWVTLIITGMRWWAGRESEARGPRAQLRWGLGGLRPPTTTKRT